MANGIEAAKQRLAEVYDPAQIASDLQLLATRLAVYEREHLNPAIKGSVQQMAELAQGSLAAGKSMAALIDDYLTYSNRIQAATYMGHQVPPPPPVVATAEALSAYTNQGLAVFEMAPYGFGIERALVKRLCAKVGWDVTASDGIVTSGGTLANLTAILAARQHAGPAVWQEGARGAAAPLVAFCSEDAHYSIMRALGISGLGTRHLIGVPNRSERGMDPAALSAAIERAKADGAQPFCVVASAPSTPLGYIDPLRAIAPICKQHGLWLHVDAVHGASFLFSDKYKHLLDGIEAADSVAWDAHKMMHVPSLCTFLLYRNKEHSFLPFKQDASYLFNDASDDIAFADGGLRTVECTKPVLTLPLWFVWHRHGEQYFADLIDVCMDLTQRCYTHLLSVDDFKVAAPPQTNILTFTYQGPEIAGLPKDAKNRWLRQIRQRLIHETPFYITGTDIAGRYHLRITFINPRTQLDDFVALLEAVRRLIVDEAKA